MRAELRREVGHWVVQATALVTGKILTPEDQRRLSPLSVFNPRHRWEDSFPKDGLVLSVITRDLPADCDPSKPCEPKWNQDRLWFSKAEARQWLPLDPKPGDKHELPQEAGVDPELEPATSAPREGNPA